MLIYIITLFTKTNFFYVFFKFDAYHFTAFHVSRQFMLSSVGNGYYNTILIDFQIQIFKFLKYFDVTLMLSRSAVSLWISNSCVARTTDYGIIRECVWSSISNTTSEVQAAARSKEGLVH